MLNIKNNPDILLGARWDKDSWILEFIVGHIIRWSFIDPLEGKFGQYSSTKTEWVERLKENKSLNVYKIRIE